MSIITLTVPWGGAFYVNVPMVPSNCTTHSGKKKSNARGISRTLNGPEEDPENEAEGNEAAGRSSRARKSRCTSLGLHREQCSCSGESPSLRRKIRRNFLLVIQLMACTVQVDSDGYSDNARDPGTAGGRA